MEKYYFILKCPKCKQNMKYHTTTLVLSNKKKRCVYCGTTFSVKKHLVEKL